MDWPYTILGRTYTNIIVLECVCWHPYSDSLEEENTPQV